MLKEISAACLGFLNGAIFGWFAYYAATYFKMGFYVRRTYLDASKHAFIALAIAIVALVVFFSSWQRVGSIFLREVGRAYCASFCVAALLFVFMRAIKMSKDYNKYEKEWPQSVGRLEMISYGNKYINLAGLLAVIILLALLILG